MSGKGKETTTTERKIILDLHAKGKSLSEIGEIISRSRYTVRSIINRFKDSKSLTSCRRSGRPKKLTNKEERSVVNCIKKNPRTTSSELAAGICEQFGKTVSTKTVRNIIHKAGYFSRIPRPKPFISKVNKAKRLEFANRYVNKETDFWDHVIFSDESKFNIFRNDGRELVWRKPNTALQKQNLLPTIKHGGGGVMVWGCMAASGVGELVFIDGTMDKMVFLNILKENLHKSADKLDLAGNFHFQQDNDPKHTAHIVKEWLLYNTPHTLKTPPQSPDMNPIEHLWDVLDKRIRKHAITSKAHLKSVLADEWAKIDQQTTKKLVYSMQNRLREVIKNKGMPTRY